MNATERIAKKLRDMPVSMRKLYRQCVEGKASPRNRIKCHCYECFGWERTEAMKCDDESCQLWIESPAGMVKKRSTGAKSGNSRSDLSQKVSPGIKIEDVKKAIEKLPIYAPPQPVTAEEMELRKLVSE